MAGYSYRLPRKYRYRHHGGSTLSREQMIGVGLVAFLILGGSAKTAAHGHGITAVTTRAVSPDGNAYTPSSWAAALLSAGGWPQTACNLGAITAWENAEGGNWNNSARFNPLDTTQPEPGSYGMNSVNVQAFPSWQAGFTATLATLNNGNYPAILSALSAGSSAQAVANAVGASPWGTGNFGASC